MLNNIKAAIFDLDGTLVDSMWVWDKIDIDFLKSKGFDVPDDLRPAIEHLSFDETARYFKERFNLTDSIDEIKDTWNNMAYSEYAHNVPLKPYARQLLAILKANGIKLALATSNSNLLLESVLKKHNIYHFFDVIVRTDEVEKGKDFPDVYLLAAERLKIHPQNCMVFEDILPAMSGAKLAKMNVVGVYDEFSAGQCDEIKSVCDLFITTFECLIPQLNDLICSS